MASVIKLERFSQHERDLGGVTAFSRDDLDMAYADGLSEGRTQRQNEELKSLSSALERLADALALDEKRRAELREEAVTALSPLLSAILDSLAPSASSARMEAALHAELKRLAALTTPLRCRITCSAELRQMVERQVASAGLDRIVFDIREAPCISLNFEGGQIDFCPERLAGEIRTLINEIMGGDEKWTH